MKKIILISSIVLAVLIFASAGFIDYRNYVNNHVKKPVACTMDAKACPDGSFVGRIVPNCEFAPCPDITAGWQIYKSTIDENIINSPKNIEFKYPKDFLGATWRTEVWPPTVKFVNGNSNPITACGNKISALGENAPFKEEQINNMKFEVYTSSDVGAGQLYSDYCYIYTIGYWSYVIDFSIHSTNGCGNGNCGPYCGTSNEQACKNFDMQKEVIAPIEQIVSTFKFI